MTGGPPPFPWDAPFWAHTATLLYSGQLLIAGGFGDHFQLYDAQSNTWTPLGDLPTTEVLATSVLLDSGRVLLSGNSMYSTSASPIFTP